MPATMSILVSRIIAMLMTWFQFISYFLMASTVTLPDTKLAAIFLQASVEVLPQR